MVFTDKLFIFSFLLSLEMNEKNNELSWKFIRNFMSRTDLNILVSSLDIHMSGFEQLFLLEFS